MNRTVQTASHWGVYDVEIDAGGEIVATRPFEADANPASFVGSLPEMVRGPLRVDRPYVRAGYLQDRTAPRRRGAEPFVPVSWETALDLVASELWRVKSEYGNEAIYAGCAGWASAGCFHHAPTLIRRFLGLFGGYVDKRGNHSFGAAMGVLPYVIGRADISEMVARWASILEAGKLIVMFGGAHAKNMQVGSRGAVEHLDRDAFEAAARAGIRFVNVSPSRENLPEHLDAEWLPIRPNTDTAFMLGLAHTLVSEDLHDRAFLHKYCEGYERFEDYLLGRDGGSPRSAAWAAGITGIDAHAIVALARRMAGTRTLVTSSWSVQRSEHGEQPVWMTVALAAMLGQIGLPGGGFSIGLGASDGQTSNRPRGLGRPAVAAGSNPVKAFVPVGSFTDMLLNPGGPFEYNGATHTYPDIKLIYAVGGNPFHHTTNLNRMLEGWQRPETIVVHEPFWTPVAKHADIVLPATTTMERNDILAADTQRYIVAMKQVIDPVGEACSDFDIFAALDERLGLGGKFAEGRDEMEWLRHIYETWRKRPLERGLDVPEFDAFWQAGRYALPEPTQPTILLEEFRADPIAHPLQTPSGKIELFSERIAGYGYDDCPPHPAWLEPREWLGSAAAARHPLHLLSNQPRTRLHSQHDPASTSRAYKVNGRERLAMSPVDAAARGLEDGDAVRVFNARGAFLASVFVVDYLRPGVVQIATGAWYDPLEPGLPGSLEKHGNPNVVTMDSGTSRLTRSPAAQTALVEVERCNDPPPVTAFELPRFSELSSV